MDDWKLMEEDSTMWYLLSVCVEIISSVASSKKGDDDDETLSTTKHWNLSGHSLVFMWEPIAVMLSKHTTPSIMPSMVENSDAPHHLKNHATSHEKRSKINAQICVGVLW